MRKIWLLYLAIMSISIATDAKVKTKKIKHYDTYFGHDVIDEYQWLENSSSPQTQEWILAENNQTHKYLSKIPYREQIKERLTELNNFEKITDYTKVGYNYIYLKNSGLQKQAVWMITPTSAESESESKVLLDPNLMDSSGTTKVTMLDYDKTLDYIGVAIHRSGSDWATLKVIDLKTRQFLSDELDWVKFSSVQWFKDGFYYSRYDAPLQGQELSAVNLNQKVYYHRLGTSQDQDVLIYKDSEHPQNYYQVENVGDNRLQILYASKGGNNFDAYYRYINSRNYLDSNAFQILFKGDGNKNYIVGAIGTQVYVLTNYKAPNYRLVSVNVNYPDKGNWVDVIPESENLLQEVKMTAGKFLCLYLVNARSKLVGINWNGKNAEEILLPGIGTVQINYTDIADSEFLYSFSSFTQPEINLSGDLSSRDFKILNEPTLNFDVRQYESKQVWYPSKDGTQIPMFIIHKKGLPLNGENPTYLYGYGGFNITLTPKFSSSYIALLEQDFVIAIPNLRGGGEFGEKWHEAGMLMKKQNVFDDFISAAEFLIREKYTNSKKIAISGGSNGGLLVGACMTQRPDLFQVAIPSVGVMDMLRYQNFTVGWGWIPEYGSSAQSEQMFQYLKSYSPYHNIQKKVKYPATLIKTADHDDRVVPAHSYKFAARLQSLSKKKNPILIRIDTTAGHGAGKPTNMVIEEYADTWAFLLWNMGIKKLAAQESSTKMAE